MQPELIHETNHHLFVRQVAYIATRGLGQMFTSRQENVTASRQIITGSNFQSHTRTLARYSSIPPFCLSSGEKWLVTSNWNGELSWLPSITSTKRHSLWASFTSYKLNGARVLNTNGNVHTAQTAVHELCDEFAASVANQHEVSDAWRDAELRMTN